MWHEARKQERKIRGMLVDYRKRAERRQDFYARIRADPTQFMQIHGRKCKIHIDANIAAAGDGPAIMMAWQGNADIIIDRFDARAHLDYIPILPSVHLPLNNDDSHGNDENVEERQCNYESYRILAQNDFLGIGEDKYLNQLYLEEQFGVSAQQLEYERSTKKKTGTGGGSGGGAAIGYIYDDSTNPLVNDYGNNAINVIAASGASAIVNSSPKSVLGSTGIDDSGDDDSDSDLDVDVSIDITKLDTTQAHELNGYGREYGMLSNDFYSFLTNDADEADALRMAREEEHEKIMLSGRKTRRERRAQRERRYAGRPCSPPSYAAKEEQPRSIEDKIDSDSRSPSPENSGKITYITSFGAEDELQPHSKISINFNSKIQSSGMDVKCNNITTTITTTQSTNKRTNEQHGTYASVLKENLNKFKSINEINDGLSRKPLAYQRRSYSRSRSRSRSRNRMKNRSRNRKSTDDNNRKRSSQHPPSRSSRYKGHTRSRKRYSSSSRSSSSSSSSSSSTSTNSSKSSSPTSKNQRNKRNRTSKLKSRISRSSSSSTSSSSSSSSTVSSKSKKSSHSSSSSSPSKSPSKKQIAAITDDHQSLLKTSPKHINNNDTSTSLDEDKFNYPPTIPACTNTSFIASFQPQRSQDAEHPSITTNSELNASLQMTTTIESLPEGETITPMIEPEVPIKRYYGRKRDDQSSSEDTISNDEDNGKSDNKNIRSTNTNSTSIPPLLNIKLGKPTTTTPLENKIYSQGGAFDVPGKNKPINLQNTSSNPLNKQLLITPRDRLKRKMQSLLNKQYKADKLAEIEKSERQIQQQQEREDEMRELALKLRRRQRELRHKYGSTVVRDTDETGTENANNENDDDLDGDGDGDSIKKNSKNYSDNDSDEKNYKKYSPKNGNSHSLSKQRHSKHYRRRSPHSPKNRSHSRSRSHSKRTRSRSRTRSSSNDRSARYRSTNKRRRSPSSTRTSSPPPSSSSTSIHRRNDKEHYDRRNTTYNDRYSTNYNHHYQSKFKKDRYDQRDSSSHRSSMSHGDRDRDKTYDRNNNNNGEKNYHRNSSDRRNQSRGHDRQSNSTNSTTSSNNTANNNNNNNNSASSNKRNDENIKKLVDY